MLIELVKLSRSIDRLRVKPGGKASLPLPESEVPPGETPLQENAPTKMPLNLEILDHRLFAVEKLHDDAFITGYWLQLQTDRLAEARGFQNAPAATIREHLEVILDLANLNEPSRGGLAKPLKI